MLSWPQSPQQVTICRDLIKVRCGGYPGVEAHYLTWVKDNQPTWVVSFDNWVGRTCQLQQANVGTGPFPRSLAKAVFTYAFDVLKLKMVFGVVDEANQAALRIDKFLGFVEEKRWQGLATSGKDLILLSIVRENCRFLEKP